MAISNSDKLAIIQCLLVTKQKAHVLEISLRFESRSNEAEQVARKAKELSDQIDRLLGQVMGTWLDQAATILQKIEQANASLESSIQEIQDEVEVAENVVKAIGYIDDAVVVASKIAATL